MTSPSRSPASLHVIWQAIKTWYDDWFNQFVLNFLVTLSWITIVLGPPMLFGLYEIGHELAHGRGNGGGELLRAAKRHFVAGWTWALLNIIVGIIIVVNIAFYWQLGKAWSIILVSVFFFLGLFWLMVQFYVIPYYVAQTDQSLKIAFKNAALTALASPSYTLVMFLYATFWLLVSFAFILPLILAAPSLVVVTGNYAVLERLQTFGIHDKEQA